VVVVANVGVVVVVAAVVMVEFVGLLTRVALFQDWQLLEIIRHFKITFYWRAYSFSYFFISDVAT
jgi:hypothetical protein